MEQRFIGRKKELEALKAEYEKEAFSATVVYGRRRVGKSFLIRNCNYSVAIRCLNN